MEFLNTEFADNTLEVWLIAAAIVVAVFLVTSIIRAIIGRYMKRMSGGDAHSTWSILRAVVKRTSWFFLLMLALYLGSLALHMPDGVRGVSHKVAIILLILQAGLWSATALRGWMAQYREHQLATDPASVATINILNIVGKVIIWSLVLLLVLDNLGVNITALVAGLGVGGIAIALAVQTILGDLLASLSIALDKPFTIGDFLIVDEHLGAVEYIGLKTTRIRSLSGEQLVFSNSDLLNSRIRNYGRMYERRVMFMIGVTYQTPRDKLVLIPEIIREAVERQDKTRFDRSHFKDYGDFSLNYESVYYVLGPDYNEYMDIQQAINLRIHERFEQEGIEFAYPTQTVFVQQS